MFIPLSRTAPLHIAPSSSVLQITHAQRDDFRLLPRPRPALSRSLPLSIILCQRNCVGRITDAPMKYRRHLIILVFLASSWAAASTQYLPQDGDILFQTSLSSQSIAIQKATHSPYSHLGIVLLGTSGPQVVEAVAPVKFTPLAEWVARGKNHSFVAKRLKDHQRLLTSEAIERMHATARAFLGKPYDSAFQWSDDRLYCSEFVWKVFKRSLALELGRLQHISDFDLSDPGVQAKVRERWGGSPPLAEPAISPGNVFASDLLMTVYQQ